MRTRSSANTGRVAVNQWTSLAGCPPVVEEIVTPMHSCTTLAATVQRQWLQQEAGSSDTKVG
jgi:hypothetical protein